MKHSPLPWKPDQDALDGVRAVLTTILDANGQEIIHTLGLNNANEDRANADYVVLACNAFPHLVSALKLVRSTGARPDIQGAVQAALNAAECTTLDTIESFYELRAAAQEFVHRCERYEVRSTHSYARFKAALGQK